MSKQPKRRQGRPPLAEVTVRIDTKAPESLRERLRAVAAAEGVKMADVAREGIEREVARRERRLGH